MLRRFGLGVPNHDIFHYDILAAKRRHANRMDITGVAAEGVEKISISGLRGKTHQIYNELGLQGQLLVI